MVRKVSKRIKGQHKKFPWSNTSRWLERVAVALLMLFAWAWVVVLFGMVFYHGYYSHYHEESRLNDELLPVLMPNASEKVAPRTAEIIEHPYETPLLIFTCKRDGYLRETLTDIQKIIPKDCSIGCPIIISQDGNEQAVIRVIQEFQATFASLGIPVIRLEHKSALRRGKLNSYQALAIHYGWALGLVFDGAASAVDHAVPPQRVIILEEDLHTAEDFFDYFAAMTPILESDRTLLAVSAFNDNGFASHVKDPSRVLRSDFFPGLGWMMTRRLWDEELRHKWPSGYWDDWLREPSQRQDRHILRPEISRTFHFGVKDGASGNQFGNRLGRILLNPTPFKWKNITKNLSHELEVNYYNSIYLNMIEAAQPVSSVSAALEKARETDVRLEYRTLQEFQHLARQLELMDDEKAGIPRTAYKGVVETRPHGEYILFLIPPFQDLTNVLLPLTI